MVTQREFAYLQGNNKQTNKQTYRDCLAYYGIDTDQIYVRVQLTRLLISDHIINN